MLLRQPKNVVEVTQVFLQCMHAGVHKVRIKVRAHHRSSGTTWVAEHTAKIFLPICLCFVCLQASYILVHFIANSVVINLHKMLPECHCGKPMSARSCHPAPISRCSWVFTTDSKKVPVSLVLHFLSFP